MDDFYDLAKKILIEIGAIKACDAHDDFTYQTCSMDTNTIYALATQKYKDSYYREGESFKPFQGAVKRVLDETVPNSNCPHCEKAYNE